MPLLVAYCVCRVHNMLLKGANCVGEHFVDHTVLFTHGAKVQSRFDWSRYWEHSFIIF